MHLFQGAKVIHIDKVCKYLRTVMSGNLAKSQTVLVRVAIAHTPANFKLKCSSRVRSKVRPGDSAEAGMQAPLNGLVQRMYMDADFRTAGK